MTSYLDQWVNYGGEWVTIGSLYKTEGDTLAGLWLSGYKAGGNDIRPRKPLQRELTTEYRAWLRSRDMTSVYRPEAE